MEVKNELVEVGGQLFLEPFFRVVSFDWLLLEVKECNYGSTFDPFMALYYSRCGIHVMDALILTEKKLLG